MKKIILFSALLSNLILIGQTKITGWGSLKLYSPISIINELGYDSIDSISNSMDYITKTYKRTNAKHIFELVADSTEKYQVSYSSFDPRVRVFIVPRYAVTENIEIENVRLEFFNDSLIEIHCEGNNAKLREALTLKYGEPEIKLEENEKQFTYTYTGNTVTKTEKTYTSIWETNDDNISCRSVLANTFNDKGEESILSFTYLMDTRFQDEIRAKEKEIKEGIEKRKLDAKKKELKGF